MYATEGFYCDNYVRFGAGKIPIGQFEYWEMQAAAELDRLTAGRIESADENIKRAVCEIADALYREETEAEIKSETTDGYSVTYAGRKSVSEKIYRIAERYLSDTDLLYRGIYDG